MSVNCSIISHKLVSNKQNFMKLILSIFDHGLMMHVKFSEDVISCRGVIAISSLQCYSVLSDTLVKKSYA